MWQCWSVVEVELYCVDKDKMFHDRVRNGCYMAVIQLPLREKGGTTPNFGPCLSWPNGWMDQDATW